MVPKIIQEAPGLQDNIVWVFEKHFLEFVLGKIVSVNFLVGLPMDILYLLLLPLVGFLYQRCIEEVQWVGRDVTEASLLSVHQFVKEISKTQEFAQWPQGMVTNIQCESELSKWHWHKVYWSQILRHWTFGGKIRSLRLVFDRSNTGNEKFQISSNCEGKTE